jgi:glycosyltransferase involved in cell wall biosynthesis
MSPMKNVKMLLDAFKIFVQKTNGSVNLVLAGNKTNEFIKYAEDLGLLNKSVFFKGEISYREVAEEMQRCHCFVLSSIAENSPCVIGEALCCGLPVIATNVGGLPELVNKTNSRLIPSENMEALIDAMEDIHKNYSSFNQLQIAEEASKRFSYSSIALKFDELYRNFC